MVEVKTYNAKSLIHLAPARPIKGHFQTAPFHFRKCNAGERSLGGAGLYAIFYKGSLIYIGKFLGTRVDWTKGSVLDTRWVKHLKAMTLLGRETSFSQKAWSSVQTAIDAAGSDQPTEVQALRSNIQSSDGDLMTTDMGCRVSYEKYVFAEEIRIERGDPSEAFADLDLLYVRYAGSQNTPSVRKLVSAAESEAIEKFRPRCNVVARSGTPMKPGREEVESTLTRLMTKYFEDDRQLKTLDSSNEVQSDEEMPQFEEKLVAAPESFQRLVKAIEDFVSEREDSSISYTDTNGGDLRVRKYQPGGVGFVNVATFTLRLKKERLVLRTGLSANLYHRIGLGIDKVVNDRLENETFLHSELSKDEADKVLALIERAIVDQHTD